MKKVIISCFWLLIISACSVSNVKFEITQPAEINIPNHIESIIIVNRTSPTKKNKLENILDGIFSGETIGVDKQSSRDCINALKLELEHSPKFDLLSTTPTELKGSGTSEMSQPLKWEKIEQTFSGLQADGLIVLESFDSSSQFRELGTREKRKKRDGKQKIIIEHIASLEVEVFSGWRIYDITNKKILDEKIFIDRKVFEAVDETMGLAKQSLPGLGSAISEAAILSGQQFYQRISPHQSTIKREYFKNLRHISGFKIKSDNSNDLFVKASEFVLNQYWQEAVKIWKQFVDSKNKEIASRACFNIALASEVNNSIDIALFWAKKSLNLGNSKAQQYVNQLEKRNLDLDKLEKQLLK